MPDRRQHRGPHPADAKLFQREMWPVLRNAVSDFSWLLSRAYSDKASLKLVGDRFQLTKRQRLAVMRCGCAADALAARRQKEVAAHVLVRESLLLDGFNVLTTIEAALSGGLVLAGRDGCYRDLASMHGSYRRVQETRPALELVGDVLVELGVADGMWYLDRPVSNSGRLSEVIRDVASVRGWRWSVELVNNPDTVLVESSSIVVSADSVVLDRCQKWFNLARAVVERRIPEARVVDLA